jgi:hypothetical protein
MPTGGDHVMMRRGRKTLLCGVLFCLPLIRWRSAPPDLAALIWTTYGLMTLSAVTGMAALEWAESWLMEIDPTWQPLSLLATVSRGREVLALYSQLRRERGLAPTAARIEMASRMMILLVGLSGLAYVTFSDLTR